MGCNKDASAQVSRPTSGCLDSARKQTMRRSFFIEGKRETENETGGVSLLTVTTQLRLLLAAEEKGGQRGVHIFFSSNIRIG